MKVYIHEYAIDTTLLYSNEGRILGVYSDIGDAQSDYHDYNTADAPPGTGDVTLDLNDAA